MANTAESIKENNTYYFVNGQFEDEFEQYVSSQKNLSFLFKKDFNMNLKKKSLKNEGRSWTENFVNLYRVLSGRSSSID